MGQQMTVIKCASSLTMCMTATKLQKMHCLISSPVARAVKEMPTWAKVQKTLPVKLVAKLAHLHINQQRSQLPPPNPDPLLPDLHPPPPSHLLPAPPLHLTPPQWNRPPQKKVDPTTLPSPSGPADSWSQSSQ